MSRLLPSYLHSLRKQWGLSQPDLAALLGMSDSSLCRFETLARPPTITLAIAAEVVFGHPVREIFPAFYSEVEDKIMKRARALHAELEAQPHLADFEKLRLLTEMIERADAHTPKP